MARKLKLKKLDKKEVKKEILELMEEEKNGSTERI